MAQNERRDIGDILTLPVSAGKTSGDPVVVGKMPGVCLTDRDTDGNATVKMRGVFDLEVEATDADGNAAVAVGDALFYDGTDISKDGTGELYGFALEAITSGDTSTIEVRIARTGEARTAGDIPAGGVGKTELAGGFLQVDLVDGGAAGDLTLTGVASGDELVFVGHLSTKAAIATLADLTSEFSITAADTINNTGGTESSSDQLMVIWLDLT